MAGRRKPMTKDEAFSAIVAAFPTCKIVSISDDHKYVTYCSVLRVCLACGNEWSTKVSNALHLGSGCKRCSTQARVRATQEAHMDLSVPACVYRINSVCGKFSKVGFTQDIKKRVTAIKRFTPFEIDSEFSIIFHGCPKEAFALEGRLLAACRSAGFSGFCGATEWLVAESLDKIMLDWQSGAI